MFAFQAKIVKDYSEEGFFIVQLSEINKTTLFEHTWRSLQARAPEAEQIVQRLVTYIPQATKMLLPKEYALSKAPLKLVFSRDASIVSDLSKEVTSYIAVSYLWHDKEKSKWEQAGKGATMHPWPVHGAFVKSILDLRQSADEGVWIDQLCINQEDEEEKHTSIGTMDVIYRAARQLVILLNDEVAEVPQEEERLIDKYWSIVCEGKTMEEWAVSDEDYELMRSTFLRILSSRWWTRAWCAHEFRVSRHFASPDCRNFPRFRALSPTGRHCVRIPAILLSAFQSYLERNKARPSLRTNKEFSSASQLFWGVARPSMVQVISDREHFKETVFDSKSILPQVLYIVDHNATSINDKVQISINVLGLPLFWGPLYRYERDEQVVFLFSVFSLAVGEISLLAYNGPSIGIPAENGTICFSWARRPLSLGTHNRTATLLEKDIGISSAQFEYLDINLLLLKKPSFTLSTESLTVADQILSSSGLYERILPIEHPADAAYFRDVSGRYSEKWRVALQRLVAMILDGGIRNLLSVGKHLRETVYPTFFSTGTKVVYNDPELAAAASTLLLYLRNCTRLPFSAHEELQGDIEVAKEDFWDEDFLTRSIIDLLAIMSDRRFPILATACRIQLDEGGTQGFTNFWPESFQYAIPVCLSGKEWASTERLWILESVQSRNGSGNDWRIFEKQLLIGCGDLVPDGTHIVKREKQRVFGGPLSWER